MAESRKNFTDIKKPTVKFDPYDPVAMYEWRLWACNVLELDANKDIDFATVAKQYRNLAIKYHPDKNPDNPNAKNDFQVISEANERLNDPNCLNAKTRQKKSDFIFDDVFKENSKEENIQISTEAEFFDKHQSHLKKYFTTETSKGTDLESKIETVERVSIEKTAVSKLAYMIYLYHSYASLMNKSQPNSMPAVANMPRVSFGSTDKNRPFLINEEDGNNLYVMFQVRDSKYSSSNARGGYEQKDNRGYEQKDNPEINEHPINKFLFDNGFKVLQLNPNETGGKYGRYEVRFGTDNPPTNDQLRTIISNAATQIAEYQNQIIKLLSPKNLEQPKKETIGWGRRLFGLLTKNKEETELPKVEEEEEKNKRLTKGQD